MKCLITLCDACRGLRQCFSPTGYVTSLSVIQLRHLLAHSVFYRYFDASIIHYVSCMLESSTYQGSRDLDACPWFGARGLLPIFQRVQSKLLSAGSDRQGLLFCRSTPLHLPRIPTKAS